MGPEGSGASSGATVGELMVPGVHVSPSRLTAGECRQALAGTGGRAPLVVTEDDAGGLGLIMPDTLLAAADSKPLGELAVPAPTPVTPDTPLEIAAAAMVDTSGPAILVADDGGELIGAVPSRRLAGVLLAEHEEDMARLGGYRAGARSALRAAEEPLGRRLWHRLPWLFVGLAGAMLSVLIVGSFEEELDEVVLLAFFVPAVVYMADAVGTQTETLVIRALAANVRVGPVIRKELLTGLALGAVVAAFFYPFALIGWENGDVALGVSLALFFSCSIATAVAMMLPLGLQRLGFDPAFGSGPLATVTQDLLSIAIYFAIGVPLAT